MPQPCSSQTPCLAKARISASGTAAPPTSERMPLRHLPAPGLLGLRAIEGLDQADPDRRHAERERRRLELHQVEQIVGMQMRPGKDQLGAEHHGAVRHAPAVGMEHRRHRQHESVARDPRRRRGSRSACAAPSSGASRPRPSAGRWCPTCSTSRPDRSRRAGRRRSRPDRASASSAHSRLLGRVTGAPENGNTMTLSKRRWSRELPVERQQHVVDDQEAVLGIVRDPADLVGRQAQVQRVHHAAGRRDAEVALEVRVVVPAQRGDALAVLQAELLQGRSQRARASVVLGVGVRAQRLVRQARDDRVVSEQIVPARSSKWLSDSGTFIIVDFIARSSRVRSNIVGSGPASAWRRAPEPPRLPSSPRARRAAPTSRPASRSRVGVHAFAQPPLFHEPFASIERLGGRVARLHVEPEAMRAEIAERHLASSRSAGAAGPCSAGCSTSRFSSIERCGLRHPCRITKPADG